MSTSTRAATLHARAAGQVAELTALLSTQDDATLTLPCPGRGKLGDGTVGAVAKHTADNYRRIAEFVQATTSGEAMHSAGDHAQHSSHLRAQDAQVDDLRHRLAAADEALAPIATLSDDQLDAVPPESHMKFCDGERTLEEVVASLLKHQRHQIDALKAVAD
jgi:hypothetical protein